MKLQTPLFASINGDFQTAVVLAAASREYSPSRAPITESVKRARFTFTSTASFADGDKVTLGSLGLTGARIIPEQCVIRGTGSVTTAVKFTLQKTDSAGDNAVALSAQTSQVTSPTATTALAIPSAGGDTVALAPTDLLKLLLNYGTGSTLTLAATNTFVVELAYTIDQ